MAIKPPSSEKEIFRKNYAKFCDVLKHEDGLLPHLVEKDIISWDDLDEIKSKNTAEKGPTLLKHISGPLDIDHTQGFYGLLEVMINHGKVDTQEFARKIKYECLSNRGPLPDVQRIELPTTTDEGLIFHDELKNAVDEISIVDTNDSKIVNTIQILLVTANETEYFAALTFLDPLEGFATLLRYHHVNSRINKHAVYIFGKFGYFNAAVHLMTKQGPAAAQDVVTVGDCFGNKLNAIFAVGVACGVEGKSEMLDVLVSKTISVYTAARISAGSDDEYKIENRGSTNMPVSFFLHTYFDQPPKWPGEDSIAARLLNKPTQHSGNILCGNYLIDHAKFKQRLLKSFAYDAIGIEMEGAGLIQDYPDTKYKIMVIKAMCDFGDGKKDKKYQPTAAMLAVECLKHCIGHYPYLPQKLADFCGNLDKEKTSRRPDDSSMETSDSLTEAES